MELHPGCALHVHGILEEVVFGTGTQYIVGTANDGLRSVLYQYMYIYIYRRGLRIMRNPRAIKRQNSD